jgi:metal-responsive CopG/Arc/MetJ family transcriptional regulator
MRVHITLSEEDVRRLDARVGARRRSRFISEAVRRALDDEQRWESLESAIGALASEPHDWDQDPAAWVRSQRRSDDRRVG